MKSSIVYGPVPSRRLGRSLGINNIPPKICSYSCTYCQLGRTPKMEVEPRSFYRTGRIAEQARTKLEGARQKGEPIDYVTFVPDGEPTLDANFGAPWCGPCRMVSPIYDKLSKEYDGRFKFCKINVDENQGTARKYQIMSIPMQMFFADGQKVDETLGAVPEALIRPKVEALVYSRTRTWLTSTK